MALLPWLDSAALFRQLKSPESDVKFEEPTFLKKLFTCRQSVTDMKQKLRLNNVANAGWWRFRLNEPTEEVFEIQPHATDVDWDRDGGVSEGERRLTRATGLFWRPHEDRFQLTLDDINEGDGQTTTMLFAENMNARNWLSRETFDIGFVVGVGLHHL